MHGAAGFSADRKAGLIRPAGAPKFLVREVVHTDRYVRLLPYFASVCGSVASERSMNCKYYGTFVLRPPAANAMQDEPCGRCFCCLVDPELWIPVTCGQR